MPQETKFCHSSALATFPFQGSGVEVVDESGTLWTWSGSGYLKPLGSQIDPTTSLPVLDAGSAQVLAMGGAFAGATGKLTKTYTAIKRVMEGMGDAFYGLAGDSTTLSAGAGTSTKGLTGAATNRYAAQMAAYLTSIGIPAADNWFGGEGLIQAFQSVNYVTYDPRFTTSGTASFFANGAQQSVAGIMWQLNSTGEAVSYTPQIAGANSNYDTVKIWYCNRTTGSFTVSQPGGGSTAQTITTTAAASTIGSVTVALTRGSGICNLTWASGDNWIIGAVFYDSQVPRLNIMTFGNYGDRLVSTYSMANNPNEWRGGAVIASMGLDGCFVDMSINHIQVDGIGGVAAFSTALTTVANDIVGSGADLILSTPHNIGTANQGATSDAYVAAIKAVAASVSGAQVFDAYAKFTPYATYSATLYYDTLHLSIAGYGAKGRQAGRFLRQMSGA